MDEGVGRLHTRQRNKLLSAGATWLRKCPPLPPAGAFVAVRPRASSQRKRQRLRSIGSRAGRWRASSSS